MHLFYTPDISPDSYSLSEHESKHCAKILRLKKGDIIFLTDGRGNMFESKIVDANPKKCIVKITQINREVGKRNFNIQIAIAPTKNISRFEWFLEKATEIGIDEITPVICEHSERKNIKTERLNKVITAAVKQSLKAYHPILNELCKFNDFITANLQGEKYIAYIDEDVNEILKNLYVRNSDVTILIGPEGDFSKNEIKLATDNGYKPISLGKSRLRTETAGVVACHTINMLND